jgi:hypothetical protein
MASRTVDGINQGGGPMRKWTEQLPAKAEFTAAEVREIAADLLSATAGDEEKAD